MAVSRITAALAAGQTTLAWVDLERGDHSEHADRIHLSETELGRADRLAFTRDRSRYLAAHAVLRQLLAERTGRPQRDLQFRIGPFGKPFLTGLPTCQFNLSHSHGVGLIGIADEAEIGVDVEVCRAVPDATDIGRNVFTASERAALAATELGRRDACFLQCWTRKEACMKAIGMGFAMAPSSFEVGIDTQARQVEMNVDGRRIDVHLQSLTLGTKAIAALAVVL